MKKYTWVIALIIGIIIGFVGTTSVPIIVLDADLENTFYSEDGLFSFDTPDNIVVFCDDSSCTLISPTEDNPQPVPDMTVTVEEGDVVFRTWENFDIPYFEQVVSSFRYLK